MEEPTIAMPHPVAERSQVDPRCARERPFVHVNLAIDARGNAYGDGGRTLPISCDEDWRRVHGLRERYAAIAVGCRTWMLDRPQLTARPERLGRPAARQPARVIFCGAGHCSVPSDDRRTFYVGPGASDARNVIHIYAEGRVLREPLRVLALMGIEDMLIEGGPTLLSSFFLDNVVDICTFFVRVDDINAARAALGGCTWLPPRIREDAAARRFGAGVLFEAEVATMGDLWAKGLEDGRSST